MTPKTKKNVMWGLKIAVCAILGVLLLINLLTVLFTNLDIRRSIQWMPGAFITIESGSMEPELHKGDLAFVWRSSYNKLKIGDIVAVFANGEFITHGIVRVDRENGRIVTKGSRNNVEDAPVGEEEYLAKMIFSIPGGAKYYEMMSEPLVTVFLLVIIAVLFFGVPALLWIYDKITHYKGQRRVGVIRVLSALLLASMVFAAPLMTSAKYFVEINGLAMPSAEAVYFSSNFLSSKSNDYHIQGWDGERYVVELDIRNYSNELLFNGAGIDVPYTIKIEKITDAGYQTSYECNIQVPDNREYRPLVTPETQDPTSSGSGDGPEVDEYQKIPGDDRLRQPYFQINGNSAGGRSQSFMAVVQTSEGTTMAPGEKIKFRITAETLPDYLYHQVLTADYTLEVATAGEFLGARSFQQSPGSTLVTYTLKTNQIAGISHRKVVIEWNSKDLYINEYDPTFLSLTLRSGNNLTIDPATDTARLTLSLQAYSSINLQFFKYSGKLDITYEDIHEVLTDDGVEYDRIQLRDVNYVPPVPGDSGSGNGDSGNGSSGSGDSGNGGSGQTS